MKRMLVTLVLGMALTLPASRAAAQFKTTDMSDLWWIPSEAGWGIQLVQAEATIFATMFVYGANRQPTWYVALLKDQTFGDYTWTGTLYATTGPWFGMVPFDPTAVIPTPVGTMTFQPQQIDAALLTYTVNGLQIVKEIQRESLAMIDFTGSYSGVLSEAAYGGPCAPAVITDATPATFHVTQNGASIYIDLSSQVRTCTLDGTYIQQGHMGQVTGNYSCVGGDSGTFAMSEMTATWFDFHARIATVSQSGCTLKGFANGLIQPPPQQ